jgi:hypothetical protein
LPAIYVSEILSLCFDCNRQVTAPDRQWNIGGSGMAGRFDNDFAAKKSREEGLYLAYGDPGNPGFNLADLDGNADSSTMQISKESRCLFLWKGQHQAARGLRIIQ